MSKKLTKAELQDKVAALGLTVVGSGPQGEVLKRDLLTSLEASELTLEAEEIAADGVEKISIQVNEAARAVRLTEGPIQNQTFEPGQSYLVPADWWRILRNKWTKKGEPYFKKGD
jgi:hypothetical protein